MTNFFAKHPIARRVLVTIAIILVYLTGRNIPLPNVSLTSYINLSPFLDTAVSLSGGSLSQIGLFSLGLAPMMYANLLVQLFSLGRRQMPQSPKQMNFRKNLLMLLIASIQGLGVAVNLRYPSEANFLPQVFQVAVLLIAGAFVINWFSNLNSEYGVGGPTMIMLTSILFNQLTVFSVVKELWESGMAWLVVAFGIWTLLTIFLIVFFERSEYRIPIQRMGIHNKYAQDSYLPIKVNVVGGLPLMYAYSLMAFPQYFLMLVIFLVPKWERLSDIGQYFLLSRLPGVLIYLVVILVLTLVLAFVTVDVITMAEVMRQSGDYIPYVRTGEATKRYLIRYIRFFAWFNAIYLMVLSGVPLFVSLVVPKFQAIAGLTGVFMMTAGMLINFLEEIRVMRLKKRYVSLFD